MIQMFRNIVNFSTLEILYECDTKVNSPANIIKIYYMFGGKLLEKIRLRIYYIRG